MKSTTKMLVGYLAILAVVGVIGILTFRIEWKVCKVCGVQSYDRYLYGIRFAPFSIDHFDPEGQAAKWYSEHPDDAKHDHDWDVKHRSLVFGGDPDFTGPAFRARAAGTEDLGPSDATGVLDAESTPPSSTVAPVAPDAAASPAPDPAAEVSP